MAQPTIQWNIVEKPESLHDDYVKRLISKLNFNKLIECTYTSEGLNPDLHYTIKTDFKYKGKKHSITPIRNGQKFDYEHVNSPFLVFLSANSGLGSLFKEDEMRYIWQEIMLDFNKNNRNYPIESFM